MVNEVEWEYNDFNQPIIEYQEHSGAVDTSNSLKVGYSYADGVANTLRPTGIQYPYAGAQGPGNPSTTIDFAYDSAMAEALSRPDQIKDGVVLSSMRYVGLSMLVGRDYAAANHTELSYGDSSNHYGGYDRFGRIAATHWETTVSSAPFVQVESAYGHDRVGNILWRKDLKAEDISATELQDNYYEYDALRQVSQHDRGELDPTGGPPYTGVVTGTREQREDFSYDGTGNWLAYDSETPSLAQTRSHNVANQIETITNPSSVVQPAYNAVGNMTTMPAPSDWTKGYTCKWDAWNRLVEIKDGATVVGAYSYDALTRRITRTANSVTRECYFNNQWRVIEERESSAKEVDYVFDPSDRWTMIRRRSTTSTSLDTTHFVLRDFLDPVAVVDTDGIVVERYGYEAFGKVRYMNPSFVEISSSTIDWNWLFHGELLDGESGLYNYGYRYYHPELGRWPSRDPIGEMGGLNVYVLVGNDGVNQIEFLGLNEVGDFVDEQTKEWEAFLKRANEILKKSKGAGNAKLRDIELFAEEGPILPNCLSHALCIRDELNAVKANDARDELKKDCVKVNANQAKCPEGQHKVVLVIFSTKDAGGQIGESWHVLKGSGDGTYTAVTGRIPIIVTGITNPTAHTEAWYRDVVKDGDPSGNQIPALEKVTSEEHYCCKCRVGELDRLYEEQQRKLEEQIRKIHPGPNAK